MIFSVDNASFSYTKNPTPEQLLLKNITFEIDKGELMAILGPNGAGKTTMLRCMMGFLNWNSGASFLHGEDIRRIPQRQLWQNIAYVPQAKSVVSSYSVEEMVLLGRSSYFGLFSQPRPEDKAVAVRVMEELSITHLAKRSCAAISGGELQMVLLARALATEPKLLILDEPESNLDFKNQLIVLEAMSGLAAKGISCIFNTHYPTHALQRAAKALLIDKQGNYIFGRTDEVITEANIAAAFGVEAIIGEVETKHNVYRNVMPLQVLRAEPASRQPLELPQKEDSMETKIAVIAVIVEDRTYAERINDLLHQYSKYIIGRVGMPYEKKDISIISVIIDAPEEEIETLSGKLGQLQGISLKTTYSRK